MEKRERQNRYPWPKGHGSLIFAQNSLHPRHESRGFFAQNKKAEKEFFDRFDQSGGYDALDGSGYRKILDFMQGKIKDRGGMTIIDMGCGSGAFTSYLSEGYPQSHVVGLDISTGCIKRARKDFPGLDFVVGDVEKTRFKPNSVDIVWYSGILYHFPDFSKVAKEAFRILKPGGLLFSYDPNYYNPAFWLYRSKNSPFYSSVGITSNERLLKAREIREVFSNYGFEMKTKIISGVKFSYVESEKGKSMLSFYNKFDQILGATPLALVIGAFILGFGEKR